MQPGKGALKKVERGYASYAHSERGTHHTRIASEDTHHTRIASEGSVACSTASPHLVRSHVGACGFGNGVRLFKGPPLPLHEVLEHGRGRPRNARHTVHHHRRVGRAALVDELGRVVERSVDVIRRARKVGEGHLEVPAKQMSPKERVRRRWWEDAAEERVRRRGGWGCSGWDEWGGERAGMYCNVRRRKRTTHTTMDCGPTARSMWVTSRALQSVPCSA